MRKKQNIFDLCTKRFDKSNPKIWFVVQVIGNIAASYTSVPIGPLFYRSSELEKIVGLKRHRQNHDADIEFSMKHAVNLFDGNITLKINFII